jgi:hypothetical protein
MQVLERAQSQSKAESRCIACTTWYESDYEHVDSYSKRNQDPRHRSRTSEPLLQVPPSLIAMPSSRCKRLPNNNSSTYKNIKREKNWVGRESGCKMKCDINVLNAWCNGEELSCRVSETGTNRPHWHQMAAGECDSGEGVAGFMMVRSVHWARCAGVSLVIRVGIWMTGFNGPIPHGCVTVSKMWTGVDVGDFGVGAVCKYVFTGYIGGYCLWRVNWRGACG